MERKFTKDKVYLRGADGTIHDYEPLLANRKGFTAVTPNSSKKDVEDKDATVDKATVDKATVDKATADKAAANKGK